MFTRWSLSRGNYLTLWSLMTAHTNICPEVIYKMRTGHLLCQREEELPRHVRVRVHEAVDGSSPANQRLRRIRRGCLFVSIMTRRSCRFLPSPGKHEELESQLYQLHLRDLRVYVASLPANLTLKHQLSRGYRQVKAWKADWWKTGTSVTHSSWDITCCSSGWCVSSTRGRKSRA